MNSGYHIVLRHQCHYKSLSATNKSQKTLNKCETRNKIVFHTRLRHPETINSVPLRAATDESQKNKKQETRNKTV